MVAIKHLGLAAGLLTISCPALAAVADEDNGVSLRSEPDLETLLFSVRAQDEDLEERDLTLEIELAERELEERFRPGVKKSSATSSSRSGPTHRPRYYDEDEGLYRRARPGVKKPSPTSSSRSGPTHRPRYYDEDEGLYRRARPGIKKPSATTSSRSGPTHRPRYYDEDEGLYRRARPGVKKPSATSSSRSGPTHRPRYIDEDEGLYRRGRARPDIRKCAPTHAPRPRYYDEESEEWV
ncbi:unnamed protein product [Clonostachys solani]|uniref:Uncharacterized protein n=1 Tax=Clonostachys solani TaxID=160281 RepID=A0A9N9Z8N6_9HYPO|nr:unnamed protein product [Clonostachys solani]